MITPDTIVNLKSIYGLTAKRNALNAQMEIGYLKNKCPKCPRNAQASTPHQSRDLGIKGISGVSLPSIPESELEDYGAGCRDTDENLLSPVSLDCPDVANQPDLFCNL